MLLLFGFASRLAALAGLAAYLASVPLASDLLLANGLVAGLLAIVLVGNGGPSVERVVAVEDAVYDRLTPVRRASRSLAGWLEPYRGYAPTVVGVGVVEVGLVTGSGPLAPDGWLARALPAAPARRRADGGRPVRPRSGAAAWPATLTRPRRARTPRSPASASRR